MKRIILNICFILFALTAVASVCACDVDNCTVEVDLSENNVENIAVDEITDETIADDINNDVPLEKTTHPSKDVNPRLNNKKIHMKIDEIKLFIITDFNNTESDYKNLAVENYTPQGVTEDLVDFVATRYGTVNLNYLANVYGVSIGEIKDTIHEIKLGKHGQYLKNKVEQQDEENYQKLADLESKLIKE